jgi:hypothetical protein
MSNDVMINKDSETYPHIPKEGLRSLTSTDDEHKVADLKVMKTSIWVTSTSACSGGVATLLCSPSGSHTREREREERGGA